MLLLSIVVGGMLGAYARFHLSTRIHARAGHAFPWGTLAVNLLGSFALGLVLASPGVAAQALRPALAVGFLGAFTTFSTFAAEAVTLAETGHRQRAAAYVAISLGAGLAAVAAGAWLRGAIR